MTKETYFILCFLILLRDKYVSIKYTFALVWSVCPASVFRKRAAQAFACYNWTQERARSALQIWREDEELHYMCPHPCQGSWHFSHHWIVAGLIWDIKKKKVIFFSFLFSTLTLINVFALRKCLTLSKNPDPLHLVDPQPRMGTWIFLDLHILFFPLEKSNSSGFKRQLELCPTVIIRLHGQLLERSCPCLSLCEKCTNVFSWLISSKIISVF